MRKQLYAAGPKTGTYPPPKPGSEALQWIRALVQIWSFDWLAAEEAVVLAQILKGVCAAVASRESSEHNPCLAQTCVLPTQLRMRAAVSINLVAMRDAISLGMGWSCGRMCVPFTTLLVSLRNP